MEDIVDFPCFGELELICRMANHIKNSKGSIVFGPQFVCRVCCTEVLSIQPNLVTNLVGFEGGVFDHHHLAVENGLMCLFSNVF